MARMFRALYSGYRSRRHRLAAGPRLRSAVPIRHRLPSMNPLGLGLRGYHDAPIFRDAHSASSRTPWRYRSTAFLGRPPRLPFALDAAFLALLLDLPPSWPNRDAIHALEPKKPSKRPGT